MINNGFHKAESPEKALEKVVAAYTNAEKKLGAKADELLRVPAKDADPAEWRKANAAALGIPEDPKGYEYQPPELPKGMKWDQAKADGFLAKLHEKGVPRDIAKLALDNYVEDQKAVFTEVAGEMQAAQDALRQELVKQWGGEAQGRLGRAVQAFHHFAAEAEIPDEARDALQRAMMENGQIKDAMLVRLFDRIAEAMGDDKLAGQVLGARGGAGVILTPAEAEARASQIKGPEGEYEKARAAGDRQRMNALRQELERLAKIRAGGQG